MFKRAINFYSKKIIDEKDTTDQDTARRPWTIVQARRNYHGHARLRGVWSYLNVKRHLSLSPWKRVSRSWIRAVAVHNVRDEFRLIIVIIQWSPEPRKYHGCALLMTGISRREFRSFPRAEIARSLNFFVRCRDTFHHGDATAVQLAKPQT